MKKKAKKLGKRKKPDSIEKNHRKRNRSSQEKKRNVLCKREIALSGKKKVWLKKLYG